MAEKSWETLEGACLSCHKCRLAEMRTNVVIGKGNRNADILFIGEGPGQQEDLQGLPFVGPAGQLLDKMLASVGLSLDDVYIGNVVKCRPPGNRDPHEDEKEACLNYLRYQLMLIQPKIIVCLGRISAMRLIKPEYRITREHGQFVRKGGLLLTAVYHPAALLRDASKKEDMLLDMERIKEQLDHLNAPN